MCRAILCRTTGGVVVNLCKGYGWFCRGTLVRYIGCVGLAF
jgi:hypothetical protein